MREILKQNVMQWPIHEYVEGRMSDGIEVSIVIPAYNEQLELGRTLEAVKASCAGVPAWNGKYEVIVCDNNSTDETAAIAHRLGAKVVFEPVNQIARARNAGAQVAQGAWLIFIDADTRPTPELMKRLENLMHKENVLAGGGRFHMGSLDFIAGIFLGIFSIWSFLCGYPGGGFLFCRRDAFWTVNGFDEEFYAAEEIYLFRKLHKLARERKGRVCMIWSPPVETSARKLRLYKPGEIGRLLWRALTRHKSTLRNKEECHIWYDGRR